MGHTLGNIVVAERTKTLVQSQIAISPLQTQIQIQLGTLLKHELTLYHKGICICSYQMLWSSATNILNEYAIYLEAKSHSIKGGIEPGTF